MLRNNPDDPDKTVDASDHSLTLEHPPNTAHEIGSPLERESEADSGEDAVTDDGDEDFEDVDTESDHDGHQRGLKCNLAPWALALHPYVQALTLSDIESCVKLEEAAFPPTERCSREKFEYRLTKAGNICLGLFSSSTLTTIDDPPITFETSRPADSFHPARTSVLIGHVIATKTCNDTIHDEDMAIDLDWQRRSTSNVPSSHHPGNANGTTPVTETDHATNPATDASGTSEGDQAAVPDQPKAIGHQELGRTVAIHSLSILPQYQRGRLGEMLLGAYCQRIESSGLADRIALLTYDRLVDFYVRQGFHNCGPSKATFGGQAWNDLVKPLRSQNDDSEDEDDEDEDDDHMFEIDEDGHLRLDTRRPNQSPSQGYSSNSVEV